MDSETQNHIINDIILPSLSDDNRNNFISSYLKSFHQFVQPAANMDGPRITLSTQAFLTPSSFFSLLENVLVSIAVDNGALINLLISSLRYVPGKQVCPTAPREDVEMRCKPVEPGVDNKPTVRPQSAKLLSKQLRDFVVEHAPYSSCERAKCGKPCMRCLDIFYTVPLTPCKRHKGDPCIASGLFPHLKRKLWARLHQGEPPSARPTGQAQFPNPLLKERTYVKNVFSRIEKRLTDPLLHKMEEPSDIDGSPDKALFRETMSIDQQQPSTSAFLLDSPQSLEQNFDNSLSSVPNLESKSKSRKRRQAEASIQSRSTTSDFSAQTEACEEEMKAIHTFRSLFANCDSKQKRLRLLRNFSRNHKQDIMIPISLLETYLSQIE